MRSTEKSLPQITNDRSPVLLVSNSILTPTARNEEQDSFLPRRNHRHSGSSCRKEAKGVGSSAAADNLEHLNMTMTSHDLSVPEVIFLRNLDSFATQQNLGNLEGSFETLVMHALSCANECVKTSNSGAKFKSAKFKSSKLVFNCG